MKRIAALFCVVFTFALVGLGQSNGIWAARTVTNADLEEFKMERLLAEQDFRKNHQKMGFPSPEELERQRRQDAKDRTDLSAQLRRERIEKERVDVERGRAFLEAARIESEERAREAEETERKERLFWDQFRWANPYGLPGGRYFPRQPRWPGYYYPGITIYPF